MPYWDLDADAIRDAMTGNNANLAIQDELLESYLEDWIADLKPKFGGTLPDRDLATRGILRDLAACSGLRRVSFDPDVQAAADNLCRDATNRLLDRVSAWAEETGAGSGTEAPDGYIGVTPW